MFQKRRRSFRVTSLLLLVLAGAAGAFAQNRGTVVFRAEPARSTSGVRDALEVTYTLVDVPKLASLVLESTPNFTVLPGEIDRQSSMTDVTPQGPVQTTTLSRTYTLRPIRTGRLPVPVAVARTTDGRVYRSNTPEVTVVAGSVGRSPGAAGRAPVDPFDPTAPLADPLAGLPQGLLPPGFDPWERVVPTPNDANRSLPRRSDLSKRLFLEIIPEKRTAWVGEPVTVRYRLTGSVDASGSLTKLPTPDGFWVQDLASTQQEPQDTAIGGQWFRSLLLKRAAFIPQRSGTLEIDPAEMNATTLVAGAGGAPEQVQIHLASRPVSLVVKPLPVGAPASFEGAVGQFSITAKLDHNRIAADGTAQLILQIQGRGNLTQIGSPTVAFPTGLAAEEPTVQDALQPDAPALEGRRSFTYLLTPSGTGGYTVPPISFSYFDPQAGAYRTIQTQPLRLDVLEGNSGESAKPADTRPAGSPWLLWLAVAGAVLLFIAILGARRRRRPRAAAPAPSIAPSPVAQTPITAIPPAAPELVPPTTLRELLAQLRQGLDGQFGGGTSELSGNALRQRLEAGGWSEPAAVEAAQIVADLEATLYGGSVPNDAADLQIRAQSLWAQLYPRPSRSA